MKKIGKWSQQFIDFCESYHEGKHMLDKVANSVSTKISYSIGVKHLSDFLNKNPSEIVNEYQADIKRDMYEGFDKWEQIFDDFTIYLKKLGLSGSSVKLFFCGAKALINANVPRSLKLKAKTPEAYSRTIKGLTIEDLKTVYDMSDLREKAFTAILKDSGLSAAEALKLNIGDLKGFESGESWIEIDVFREKEHVEYTTFLGPNAVDALRLYMRVRKRRGETITKDSPIFASEHTPYERLDGNALKVIYRRLWRKTGFEISTHRIRKFFETYMALTVRHPIILKFWMGHKLKVGRDIEARYIIPPIPEQLKLYKESYKNIDLTPKPDEFEMVIAETKVKTAKMTPEEKRRFIMEISTRHPKFLQHPDIKRILEKSTKGGGLALEPKFKEVGESELLVHLTNGWQVAYKLQNGNVIIQKG